MPSYSLSLGNNSAMGLRRANTRMTTAIGQERSWPISVDVNSRALNRTWTFPGNETDTAIIRRVKDDLGGWRLHRMVWVADRGLTSAANRAYLTRDGGHYIHAEKLRQANTEALTVGVGVGVDHLGGVPSPHRTSSAQRGLHRLVDPARCWAKRRRTLRAVRPGGRGHIRRRWSLLRLRRVSRFRRRQRLAWPAGARRVPRQPGECQGTVAGRGYPRRVCGAGLLSPPAAGPLCQSPPV